MKRKNIGLSIVLALGMGMAKSFASPSVLLTLNVSDPSAVTITATGLNSDANSTTTTANDGVDLLNFFSQDESSLSGTLLPNSTLSGGGVPVSYNDVAADNYSGGGVGSSFDLSLFVDFSDPAASDSQTFSTTQPAFTGSWTLDLSSLGVNASALPTPGSGGNILSGYSVNPGTVIGQWQVEAVPEPGMSSFLLMASGVGFVFWRRRAAKNANTRA